MSRGRLASELGVDKSLVGRWVSGAVNPSSHNLENLTRLIASKRDGFTMLDWDRDFAGLATLFEVEPTLAEPALKAAAGGVLDALFGPLQEAARNADPDRVAPYEGFWRSTMAAPGQPVRMLCIYGLIRRAEHGLIEFRGGCAGLLYDGFLLPAEGKLFAMVLDVWARTPVAMILNTVSLPRATRLDGLVLTALMDSNRTPLATPIVFERIGDLCGDREADNRTFDELKKRKPFPEADEFSPEVQAHIVRDFGPSAALAGGDQLLMSSLARSLTTGAMAAQK
ncbi:helix-turn-helix transcriptional regulator [Phenylobacterium sp.]|uniref:helix-turn-helix domain-containing protein n=1 Tax=Phenylobacterium sp. TaxID=1871053 RepID=UPI0030F3D22A